MTSNTTVHDHVASLVTDIDRLAQWLGREEPRRHQLRQAIVALRRNLDDPAQTARAILRCAVTADRMYSSCIKRRIRSKLRACYSLVTAASH